MRLATIVLDGVLRAGILFAAPAADVETGARLETLLLNRDPEAGPAGVSSPPAPAAQSVERNTP